MNLTIEFDNEKAMLHFKGWLSGQGEQDYWLWMECREQEEEGDITATEFRYFHNKIIAKCGRLDNNG
jgi:hypothetical protein